MWRKVLLLVGLAATFGGVALRVHNHTRAALSAHEKADAAAMAGMNHGMATGNGTPGVVSGLELKLLSVPAAGDVSMSFQILNQGVPVTEFAENHTKKLHFVLVRTDLSGFQHIHPTMTPDGTWTTSAKLTAGSWRAIADSLPTVGSMSMQMILAADFTVPGVAVTTPLPPAAITATVDGYTVTASGAIGVGHAHNFTLTVTKDGAPVTDIGEYLGAYGHLVAIDTKKLTYNHLHPGRVLEPGVLVGPDVVFQAQLPADSLYRLFFEFNAGGSIHRAEFTMDVFE